jgi:hypothetical protein
MPARVSFALALIAAVALPRSIQAQESAAPASGVRFALLPIESKTVPKSHVTAVDQALRTALASSGDFTVLSPEDTDAAVDAAHRKTVARCKDNAACVASAVAGTGIDFVATGVLLTGSKGVTLAVTVITVAYQRTVTTARTAIPLNGDPSDSVGAVASLISTAVTANPAFAYARSKLAKPVAAAAPTAPASETEPAPATDREIASQPPPPPVVHERRPPRSNGFLLGFEFGGGPWSANPQTLINGAPSGTAFPDQPPIATAQAFTAPIDGKWLPQLNLHLGWNVLGYGAIEAAFQSCFWNVASSARGGSGLAGGRATIYPFQFIFPERVFDAGIEFGGGYSIAGGPKYGMDGTYFQFGLTAEYYVARSVSLEAFYRLFTPFWNRFYTDYNNHQSFAVSNFNPSWNSLGIGLNFHVST